MSFLRSTGIRRKRVLVIGHDAHRAGAQIGLLHLLRWLVGNYPADVSLLVLRGGELLSTYAEVLPTRVMPPPGSWRSLPGRVARRLINPRWGVTSGVVDLVYANTVPSLGLGLRLAAYHRCPMICHIHELDLAIHRFVTFEGLRDVQGRVDAFIAVAEAVAANLAEHHGVDPARIHQIYEAIALPIERLDPGGSRELRATLGVPADAFVVGGCGAMDLRKAPETFLQIARVLKERKLSRPLHFLWVGGRTEGWEWEVLMHDVVRMGLGGVVHFVGPQNHPAGYFSLFDVFMLTSREDPFPLVCLEAAALGVPTVCFAGAGGMPEFVGEDAGFVVPYLDIGRACDRIGLLVEDEDLRSRLGRCAAEKVKRHDIAVIGPRVGRVLDKYLH